MAERAGFRIEHDPTGRPRAVPHATDFAGMLPPAFVTAIQAAQALMSLIQGSGGGATSGVTPGGAELAATAGPRSEQEWLQIFRQSSPHQVKRQFLEFFSQAQDQSIAQLQTAKATIYRLESKLKDLHNRQARLKDQVKQARALKSPQPGVEALKRLYDLNQDETHLVGRLEDARAQEKVASRTLELTDRQLRQVENELERWLDRSATRQIATAQEGVAQMLRGMTRMLEQLSDEAVSEASSAAAFSDIYNRDAVRELDLRDAWAQQQFEKDPED